MLCSVELRLTLYLSQGKNRWLEFMRRMHCLSSQLGYQATSCGGTFSQSSCMNLPHEILKPGRVN